MSIYDKLFNCVCIVCVVSILFNVLNSALLIKDVFNVLVVVFPVTLIFVKLEYKKLLLPLD